MTDQMDRLKHALEATKPEPDPKVRREAMDAAMRAFDEENSPATQGSAAGKRQNGGRVSLLDRLFGGFSMINPMPNLKPMLMGGASVAVIAIAVLATRDMPRKSDLAPLPAPVERSAGAGQIAGGESNELARVAPAKAERESLAKNSPADLRTGASNGVSTGRGDAVDDSTAVMVLRQRTAQKTANHAAVSGGLIASEPQAEVSSMFAAAPVPSAVGQIEQNRSRRLIVVDEAAQPGYRAQGRNNFEEIAPNPVKVTAEEPVSTFSIDVDTASYSFMRRELMRGVLPQKDAVRVEEMINYFPYAYEGPQSRKTPFHTNVQIIPTPWNANTRLMRIGIKGYALSEAEKPRANLVFLIDTSGSMNAPDKLPLLVNSFRLLLDSLDPDDTVAIVIYAGSAGTVLEPTKVSEAGRILASLERLGAGGSTAGAEGIRQAYRLAEQSFDPEGVNRVILATDGDFNVGITDMDELQGFIERKRETGVLLSVLGFGQGNLNDALMQTLAQNGNGQAAYIDTLNEARKALVEEAGSTLFPIAKDVKIQIEFNPARVSEYRLIGYETRLLAREDFNNDRVDAGEIGSGHTVTALYEITPVGSEGQLVDDLRYQAGTTETEEPSDEYAFLKIRYKAPGGDVSKLIETPITRAAEIDMGDVRAVETRFAAAVAGFGQLLRGGRHMGEFSYGDVVALANSAKGDDPFGYRAEFVNLVRLAKSAAALEPLKP
jgi:Ca-activated chloride channel family protein